MVWLIVIIAVFFAIAGLVLLTSDDGEGVVYGLFCFVFMGILFWIPTNKGEPQKIEHVSVKQNYYQEMKFDSVATIEYDIVDYSTWSYAGNNNKENVVIIIDDKKIEFKNKK